MPPDDDKGAGSPIRVLVVDDSAFMRKAITRILTSADDIEVVGTAATGEEALRLLEHVRPDVMTLDVVLPGPDGLAVLERVMRECPLPVLMLSTLTTSDADTTLAALEKGAVDVVSKPAGLTHMNMPTISGELIGKVRAAAAVDVTTLARTDEPGVAAEGLAAAPPATPLEAVVIGASTGGPPAVGMLLSVLPRDFPAPVLVIQHMPVGFTSALAERTARTSALPVAEASDGDIFEPGRLFIARSGQHVRFQRRRSRVSLRLDRRPGGTTHTPSIDVTMASAAEVFGERAMGILLTGMGDDGARGLLAMREAGAYTVAEAESSSVVWGMPRVAAEIGAAETVADLTEIPSLLLRRGGFG